MSSIAHDIAQRIQAVVDGGRPGLRRVFVVVAEYADGSETAHPISPDLQETDGLLGRSAAAEVVPNSLESSPPGDALPDRRSGESVVSYVQRIRRERGRVELKPRHWAPITGLSVNEIERAMEHGAIEYRVKPNGRDHGAKIISADAMLGYLVLVDAVERGDVAQPSWWPAVRPQRRRAA